MLGTVLKIHLFLQAAVVRDQHEGVCTCVCRSMLFQKVTWETLIRGLGTTSVSIPLKGVYYRLSVKKKQLGTGPLKVPVKATWLEQRPAPCQGPHGSLLLRGCRRWRACHGGVHNRHYQPSKASLRQATGPDGGWGGDRSSALTSQHPQGGGGWVRATDTRRHSRPLLQVSVSTVHHRGLPGETRRPYTMNKERRGDLSAKFVLPIG